MKEDQNLAELYKQIHAANQRDYWIIAGIIAFVGVLVLCSGCATTAPQPHVTRTYSCAPDLGERCHLIDSGAHWAQQHGYTWVRVADNADLEFVRGSAESAFAGSGVSAGMVGMPLHVPAPMAAIECRDGRCEVNALVGVQIRPGDLVAMAEDIFEGAR